MAEQFYTILTSIGKAKIANASALGNKINFTHFALGDGGGKYYNPTESQEKLANEVWRGQIGSITVDEENPNWIVLETIIPADQGGFMIREAGVFDDEGNLLAIGKYPETYKPQVQDGSAKDLYIRMILEVSNTAAVNLKVDPGVILATQKQVNEVEVRAKDYTDKKVGALAGEGNSKTVKQLDEELKTHKADLASQELNKGASLIGIHDIDNLFTATNVEEALNELFTNVSNGKSLIAGAITDKGVPADPSDAFVRLADLIKAIKVGDYSIGDTISAENLRLLKNFLQIQFFEASSPSHRFGFDVDSNEYIYRIENHSDSIIKSDLSGKQLWKRSFELRDNDDLQKVLCSSDDKYIYVKTDAPSYEGPGIYKLDSNGEIIWEFATDDVFTNDIYLSKSDKLYVGGSQGYLYILNSSGKLEKKMDLNDGKLNDIARLAISNDEVYVYVALRSNSEGSCIRKINLNTGAVAWDSIFPTIASWVGFYVDVHDNFYFTRDQKFTKVLPDSTIAWESVISRNVEMIAEISTAYILAYAYSDYRNEGYRACIVSKNGYMIAESLDEEFANTYFSGLVSKEPDGNIIYMQGGGGIGKYEVRPEKSYKVIG